MKRQHMLQPVQRSTSRRALCSERGSSDCLIVEHLENQEQAILGSPSQIAEGQAISPLRVCRECRKEKPETKEFFQPAKHYPKDLHTHCRECRSQYYKDWRGKQDPEYLRRKAMKELYNTTIEWYDAKLKEQEGHCALCEATQFTHRKRMGIDHDHNCCPKRGCGKCNRGILCATCNYRVGQLEAVLKEAKVVPTLGSWIERAINYLNQYRSLN